VAPRSAAVSFTRLELVGNDGLAGAAEAAGARPGAPVVTGASVVEARGGLGVVVVVEVGLAAAVVAVPSVAIL